MVLSGRLPVSSAARALPTSHVQLRDHNKEQDLSPEQPPQQHRDGLTPPGVESVPSAAPEEGPQQSCSVTRFTLPSLAPEKMLL